MDYYEVLDVSPDANIDEINKAFRMLSKKYHPDKNKNDSTAHQKYLDVTKAHDVLSDSSKRQIYDLYGEEGLADPNNFNLRRGPSYNFNIEVDLEDLYTGAVKETSIRRNELCSGCKGTGAKDRKTTKCPACNGKGVRMQRMGGMGFNMQMQVQCDRCRGRGFLAAERCDRCSGKRVLNNIARFNVQIEQGMSDGTAINFPGQSEQSPDFFPGDIKFIIKTKPHSRFTRRGNDLYTTLRLSLKEALLGYTKEIAHLDGHRVRTEFKGVTQPGFTRRIRGEGMPVHEFPSNTGDLIIEFAVDLPRMLSNEQENVVKDIFI